MAEPLPPGDARTNDALADYEATLDAGAPPDREPWLAGYPPPVADELRSALDDLDRVRAAATPIREMVRTARRQAGVATGAPADAPLPALADYEVLHEIGRGGMGVVYMARQISLNRPVAIKVLLGATLTAEQRARFRSEALALARLDHPCIVRVHAFDEAAEPPYLVLGLVDGGALDRRAGGPPWAPADALALMVRLADAVACYHRAGVIHRDLKPSNILLKLDGTPMITDFGVAKLIAARSDDPTQIETRRGMWLGSPLYMAPEQYGTPEVGPPADVYALGAILYELLTGRAPFLGATEKDLFTAKLAEAVEPPSRVRPGLSPAVDAICLKCLRRDPAQRYATADELRVALEDAVRADAIAARPVRRTSARRLVTAAVVLAMLALLTTAAVLGLRAPARPFYPLSKALAAVVDDLKAAPEPKHRRYLTLAHFESDASLPAADLARFRDVLRQLGAHLGPPGAPLVRPVGTDGVVYVLDWSDDEKQPTWRDFLADCPYTLQFDEAKDDALPRLERAAQTLSGQHRPFVRADWFVRQAIRLANEQPGWLTARGPIPAEVRQWAVAWEARPVGLPTAAAELDLADPTPLPGLIAGDSRLAVTLKLGPLAAGGTVSRPTWESQAFTTSPFQELARTLGRGTPVSER